MEPTSSNQVCKHQLFVICKIIWERSLKSYTWSFIIIILKLHHERFCWLWCEPLKLNCSFLDDSWHTIGNDPFGSASIHVLVSLIVKRPCYNDQPMEITLDLALFFFHVVSCSSIMFNISICDLLFLHWSILPSTFCYSLSGQFKDVKI